MSEEGWIRTLVTIEKALSPRTCHAVLPNGKVIFAFIPEGQALFPLNEGAALPARLNVADFSRGMFIAPVQA